VGVVDMMIIAAAAAAVVVIKGEEIVTVVVEEDTEIVEVDTEGDMAMNVEATVVVEEADTEAEDTATKGAMEEEAIMTGRAAAEVDMTEVEVVEDTDTRLHEGKLGGNFVLKL